jgi:hypothetical protein
MEIARMVLIVNNYDQLSFGILRRDRAMFVSMARSASSVSAERRVSKF